MKFGGTSVQDAAAIERASGIVGGRVDRRPVVVVSALAKVTDSLLHIAQVASERRMADAEALIGELQKRHHDTAHHLLEGKGDVSEYSLEWLNKTITANLDELSNLARSVATLGELTPRSLDAIASFGERLSSAIVAAGFAANGVRSKLVDSRLFIVTDNHFTAAAPDMRATEERTRKALTQILESGIVPVTQGFIGATDQGITTTLGRGGSDYSAAIIGASLGADAIEIWTDVDGLMTADPRVVPLARRLRVISFGEASELSYFGAKVLHPSTVLPAVERGIPVHIYNTNNPSCDGTLIAARPNSASNPIKSIAFKRGVTIVNVTSTRMLAAHGFLRAIFEVFDRHDTPVDVVTTSEVSVSITLDDTSHLSEITSELSGIGQATIERDKAIVCVVGDNLKFTPGVAARVFTAIARTNVNMISQGASEINLTFVINESDVEHVVRELHDEFFAELDPEVFA
jgi:aspartate kinase